MPACPPSLAAGSRQAAILLSALGSTGCWLAVDRSCLHPPASARPATAPCSPHTPVPQVNGCVERGIEAAAWSSETPEHVKARLERELLADLEDGSLSLL